MIFLIFLFDPIGQQRQKVKMKHSQKLRQNIVELFGEHPSKLLHHKRVATLLDVSGKEARGVIFSTLKQLTREGLLEEVYRGKFRHRRREATVEGKLSLIKRGDGFVLVGKGEKDIFVDKKYLSTALHGDTVKLALLPPRRRKGRAEGRVVEVLHQQERKIVGTLEVEQGRRTFLVPDDPRINIRLHIEGSQVQAHQSGWKAVAQLTNWPKGGKNPTGKITELLGDPESAEIESKAILAAHGISSVFSEVLLSEAHQIPMKIPSSEIARRRDYREVLTFTIDPVDAKDFDDAISIEMMDENTTRIGVHIADVSHYVQEDSVLDREAKERGNSVYLVDRVIPMLPEHLSNGVCSLRPDEEKLAFSAIFDVDDEGAVQHQWFGKTVIRSDRRFTYEEAQSVIETTKGDHAEALLRAHRIAQNLRAKRIQDGALEIHSTEIQFQLNEQGKPVGVAQKIQKEAHQLVEEYMLLANRQVGAYVGSTRRKTTIPFIYRVHDKPDLEKVQQFALFVSSLGDSFSFENTQQITKAMNALFQKTRNENKYAFIQQMAIKTMAKAVYDTQNSGHYGLGLRYYTHFTSPIRRYADLMVHRILWETLSQRTVHHNGLTKIAQHISATERKAVDAERTSKKYFQALYLKDQEGAVFKGFITGLTDWGIYVEMQDNFCEGMIPLKSMKAERYQFDPQNYVVYGTQSGEEFHLGDHLSVKIVKVSLTKKQIDLVLSE